MKLRLHLQQDRQAKTKSVTASQITENFDVFDFALTTEELAVIDALDTRKRGGPAPKTITRQKFWLDVPKN